MTVNLRTDAISSPFGAWEQWRKDAGLQWHSADDIPCDLGEPIVAPDHGAVVYSGPGLSLGDLGYYTIFDAGSYGLLLAHQDQPYPELVRQGVRPGDIIGFGGNTGFSTGPHVHLVMSTLRFKNGRHNFTREAGGLVGSRLWFESGGYNNGPMVFNALAGQNLLPAPNPWATVTPRTVTRAEYDLTDRVGVEAVTVQVAGQWITMGPDNPPWTFQQFPPVLHKDSAVFLKVQ